MPTFAVSSPWKKQVFCYCMVSLTRLFYRSSPSLNEVFLFTIFLVVTAQQTYLFPFLLIQLYPIVLFQLSPLHFTLSLTYSDFASLWDSVLVPDLQKAIPWSCAAGHPIRCHANTAHSVVMTRQHSCKRQTLFYYRYFYIWCFLPFFWSSHLSLYLVPVTHPLSPPWASPRCCSWSRRTQRGWVFQRGRERWKSLRTWCWSPGTWWAPGLNAGRTACRKRRLNLWSLHCHWGKTEKKN